MTNQPIRRRTFIELTTFPAVASSSPRSPAQLEQVELQALKERLQLVERKFNDLILVLRRSSIQAVRAHEKGLYSSQAGDSLRHFMDENRRASGQMVSFTSRIMGLSERGRSDLKHNVRRRRLGKNAP